MVKGPQYFHEDSGVGAWDREYFARLWRQLGLQRYRHRGSPYRRVALGKYCQSLRLAKINWSNTLKIVMRRAHFEELHGLRDHLGIQFIQMIHRNLRE